MRFHIITLFPGAFRSYLGESILKRAIEDKKISVKFYNPRDFADRKPGLMNKAVRVDRKPFGGGPGMVIQAEPIIRAVEGALKIVKRLRQSGKDKNQGPNTRRFTLPTKIIWLSPSGKQFDAKLAKNLAKKYTDVIFICGRYEGVDARVKKVFKVEEISVGPFILTGGELPAMTIIDSVSRQIPGVLGDLDSLEETRAASADVYTRPQAFKYKSRTYRVPKVLLSGHHGRIEAWRKRK